MGVWGRASGRPSSTSTCGSLDSSCIEWTHQTQTTGSTSWSACVLRIGPWPVAQ